MTRLRLLQVGMGGWGQDWARRVLLESDVAELVACVDVAPELLAGFRKWSSFPKAACHTGLEAALAAHEVDAVLVTTSLAGHVPVALAAIAAGKHVLIEKPFAPSVAEGREVVAAAAAAGVTLMVSQNYRHYPAVRALRSFLRASTLGRVTAVDVEFRKYDNTAPVAGYRHYAIRHPLLLDMSIHHFDLLRSTLAQEPLRIACSAWNPPWSRYSDPAAARAVIEMDGGAVVGYAGSWVSTAPATTWGGSWRVECEGGVIEWTSRDDRTTDSDRVTVRPFGKRRSSLKLPPMTHFDRAGALAEFVGAVRCGTEPGSSGRDNLGSLALTFAAIRAAETGEMCEVEPATIPAESDSGDGEGA